MRRWVYMCVNVCADKEQRSRSGMFLYWWSHLLSLKHRFQNMYMQIHIHITCKKQAMDNSHRFPYKQLHYIGQSVCFINFWVSRAYQKLSMRLLHWTGFLWTEIPRRNEWWRHSQVHVKVFVMVHGGNEFMIICVTFSQWTALQWHMQAGPKISLLRSG